MTTGYDTDPNTQTVAAAWASSALGRPDFGPDADTVASPPPRRGTKPALAAMALIGGVGAGIALGLTFIHTTPTGGGVPGYSGPGHAVVTTEGAAPTHDDAPTSVAPAPAHHTGTAGGDIAAPNPQPTSAPVPQDPQTAQPPAPEDAEAPAPQETETAEPPAPSVPSDPPKPPAWDPGDLDIADKPSNPGPDPGPPPFNPGVALPTSNPVPPKLPGLDITSQS